MSCPAFEDCNKKSCIEESVCMNAEYWAEYWKKMGSNGIKPTPEKSAVSVKKRYRQHHYQSRGCVKEGDWCDKKRSCEIMGQCIFTIPRFADNPQLLNALNGPHTPEQVIKILREHDPEPMRSYYFCQDKKSKKQ